MSLLQAALDYAASGYRVHPCRPSDKRPLTKWSITATTDSGSIKYMWNLWPDALIAVCTGSGLVVVDDDRGLAEPDPDLAGTLTCRTRSRGFHHWYTATVPIGCAVGLMPGIDIRGEGGYVIAPPSPGWEWISPSHDRLELPVEVANAITHRSTAKSAGFEPAPAGSVGEGYRHDYMVRFAGWAVRVLEADADDIVNLCLEEYARACSPADAPPRNIARIAHSILRQHERS